MKIDSELNGQCTLIEWSLSTIGRHSIFDMFINTLTTEFLYNYLVVYTYKLTYS